MKKRIRLGVNIDHVATVRNARGEDYPSPLKAARLAESYGADSVTIHLREDRRHIKDKDVEELKNTNYLPLNLEMAATDEMKNICFKTNPFSCCIVPERREELTTEGGLDVKNQLDYLGEFVSEFKDKDIKLSFFVDPDIEQIDAVAKLGVKVIEIHTGKFAINFNKKQHHLELNRIKQAAEHCLDIGIDCHAGHGLNFDNVKEISKIPNIMELNVGHFLISNAIMDGLDVTIKKFMKIINHPSI